MEKKVALIIGGSKGIGYGIANTLAGAEYRVLVLSRTPPNTESGCQLEWRKLDLSNLEESRCQLQAVLEELNYQVDAVFYSAIHYGDKRALFLEVKESEWQRQLNVNLNGLWLTLSLTLPALKKRQPSLFVHVSSEVVYNGGPGRSGYAATKAAASNLIRSIAQEDLGSQVRLVQILPAKMVDTAGIRARRPADFDYSAYMTPQHFQQAILQVVRTQGEGMHGESWVVDEYGQLCHVEDVDLLSNSRRVIE